MRPSFSLRFRLFFILVDFELSFESSCFSIVSSARQPHLPGFDKDIEVHSNHTPNSSCSATEELTLAVFSLSSDL